MMTVEEMNVLACYDTTTKEDALAQITADLPSFTDEELIEIAEEIIRELSAMSDSDFEELRVLVDEEVADE